MLLSILLVVQILVSIALIAVVLLQRSEGGALGMGGGPTGFMTARGAGDLLTKATWTLGAIFFALSLGLTFVAGRDSGTSSVVDRNKIDAIDPSALKTPPAGTAPAPTTPQPAPFQAPTPQVRNPFGEAPAATLAPTPPAQPANP
jgi:preprotein translocase subunit SecG